MRLRDFCTLPDIMRDGSGLTPSLDAENSLMYFLVHGCDGCDGGDNLLGQRGDDYVVTTFGDNKNSDVIVQGLDQRGILY